MDPFVSWDYDDGDMSYGDTLEEDGHRGARVTILPGSSFEEDGHWSGTIRHDRTYDTWSDAPGRDLMAFVLTGNHNLQDGSPINDGDIVIITSLNSTDMDSGEVNVWNAIRDCGGTDPTYTNAGGSGSGIEHHMLF